MTQTPGPRSPNVVTIFGAGIAGLTAAHELVERGFHVQVWECNEDQRHPERGCDAGGLARTQWGAIDWPPTRSLDQFRTPERAGGAAGKNRGPTMDDPAVVEDDGWEAREAGALAHIPYKFYIEWDPGSFVARDDLKTNSEGAFSAGMRLPLLLATVSKLLAGEALIKVTLAGYGVRELSPEERQRRAAVVRQLVTEEGPPEVAIKSAMSDPAGLQFEVELLSGTRITIDVIDGGNPDWVDLTIESEGKPPLKFTRLWSPRDASLRSIDEEPIKQGIQNALDYLKKRPHVKHVYLEVAGRALGELSQTGLSARAAELYALFERNKPTSLKIDRHETAAHATAYTLTFPKTEGPGGNDQPRVIELIPVVVPELPFPTYETASEGLETVLSFRAREHWLPGEHGYRFFPSFYHHVFDTMKRIPLLDVVPKPSYTQSQERAVGIRVPEGAQYEETGRTVFDNIKPTSSHMLALASEQRPSQLSRFAVNSLEELREYLNVLFGDAADGGLGLDPRDAARIALKLMQFATSSEERRRGYENMSWEEYLDAESYQPETREIIRKWPRALVAMSADECDARTEGVPLMQLLLDQLRPAAYRDGTLVGPTSEAWLKPWRLYLEAQGVEFIHGELEGFYQTTLKDESEPRILPMVKCYDERYAVGDVHVHPGYVIVAVPALVAGRIATQVMHDAESNSAHELLKNLADCDDFRRVAAIKKEEQFRQFSGIQFYFAEDVLWADGHVYYPDSPWGLTSISQARFWQDRMDWEHGYRGILSVIVGEWDKDDEDREPRKARDCTAAEVARRVWAQIKTRIRGKRNRPGANVGRFARRTPDGEIPDPIAWQIDRTVRPADGLPIGQGDPAELEKGLMFIAPPGKFKERPGSLDGYAVNQGIVFAGHYTQTYTRLPCMEAANESARHAVNAIIRDIQENGAGSAYRPGSYCDIWNPEDREIDDLQFLKNLDQKLCERDTPHLFEVVGADFLAAHVLKGDARDPLDPLRLLSKLRRLMGDAR